MGIEVKQNTVSVQLFSRDNGVASSIHEHGFDGDKVLPLHYSIMGEVEPKLAPLSIDYSLSSQGSYRYDWIVGLGPPPRPWDWHKELRQRRAVTVQLAIDCGDTGAGFSDASPALLGLQPSLNTSSLWDRKSETFRQTVQDGAKLLQPFMGSVLPGVVQIAANFISSGEKDAKNWWMYRFFESKLNCPVIEWNINNKVLWEYGPLLRGSLVLSFHGRMKEGSAIRLILRPRLGFDSRRGHEVKFEPPVDDFEKDPRMVALNVRPVI